MDAAVDATWEKRGFFAGILFVILNVVGFVIAGSPPSMDASAEKIQKYFADHGDEMKIGAILFSVSVIFGIIFVASLWRKIAQLEPRGPRLALMVVLGFLFSGVAAGVSQALVSGWLVRFGGDSGGGEFVWTVSFTLFGLASAGIAVHMLAISALTMRSGFLPAWTGWIALVGGLASAVGTGVTGSSAGWVLPFALIGFLGWLLWTLIASVLLLRKAA